MSARELTALGDLQTKQMGSLLSRMTNDTSGEIKLTRTQVNAWIEVAIPRLVKMPGMPENLKCELDKTSDDSWVLRISRPPA